MNPLIFVGLGVVALMAMGGKKKPKSDSGESDDGPKTSKFQAVTLQPKVKQAVLTKLPPLNYVGTINIRGALEAKQCHLQGMNNVDQIAVCIANRVFPGWDWSSPSGWMMDAMARMKNNARMELGMPPIIT